RADGPLRLLPARDVVVHGAIAVGQGELHGGVARAPDVAVGHPQQVADRVVIGIQANPFLPLRDRIPRVLSIRVDIAQVAVVDGDGRFLPGDLPQLLPALL